MYFCISSYGTKLAKNKAGGKKESQCILTLVTNCHTETSLQSWLKVSHRGRGDNLHNSCERERGQYGIIQQETPHYFFLQINKFIQLFIKGTYDDVLKSLS